MTDRETKLLDELLDFRDTAANQLFGKDNPLYGPENLMSEAVLQRLIDITRVGVSTITVETLPQETGWARIYAQRYGAGVLAICKKYRPQPQALSSEEPHQSPNSDSVLPSTPSALPALRKRAPPTCSACGAVGHQSEFFSLLPFPRNSD